jgi:arsenate reductase
MTFKVLVLCTGNSARSILGEMLFNHLGKGRIEAHSAGSKPGGVVNPVALETLEKHGVPCAGVRSKSWDEFAAAGARVRFHLHRLRQRRPEDLPGLARPSGDGCTGAFPIPAHVEPLEARRAAFEEAYQSLKKRIEAFLALPLETLSREKSALAARRIHEEA